MFGLGPEGVGAPSLDGAASRLAEIDPGFGSWLSGLGGEGPIRSAQLRKAATVIQIRSEMLAGTATGVRRRTRFSSLVWTGAPAVLAMADGSPRRLLGMLDSMLERSRDGSVPRGVQVDVVARFQLSMLHLLDDAKGESDAALGARLVQQIGVALEGCVLGPTFNADPALSFVVDTKVSPEMRTSIENALNLGVLMPIDSAYSSPLRDLSGGRLRLAYLLAPRFCLPLRLGRSVSLTRLLGLHEGLSVDGDAIKGSTLGVSRFI